MRWGVTVNVGRKFIKAAKNSRFFIWFIILFNIILQYQIKKTMAAPLLIPIAIELIAATSVAIAGWFGYKYTNAEKTLQQHGLSSNDRQPEYKQIAMYAIGVMVVYGIVKVLINITKK